MIPQSLQILNNELQKYLDSSNFADFQVEMGNFALAGSDSQDLQEKIIQTLIMVDEDRTWRAHPPKREKMGNQSVLISPEMWYQLSVLYISNFSNYEKALFGLSHVIKFFEVKPIFSSFSSDFSGATALESKFKLIVSQNLLNFEQTHHLWNILGGKHYPSAMYQVRMVMEE